MSSAAVIDHTQRDPWEAATEQFDTAADKLHLDPNMRGTLRECQRELTVHFPVRLQDGAVQALTGGSEGRNEATARGAVYTTMEASKHLGMDLEGARVVVQGFGNAGSFSAKLMAELGAVVVGLSDTQGGIHNPKGIDPNKVDAYKRETGSVVGLPGTETVSNSELLELDCDILIPA